MCTPSTKPGTPRRRPGPTSVTAFVWRRLEDSPRLASESNPGVGHSQAIAGKKGKHFHIGEGNCPSRSAYDERARENFSPIKWQFWSWTTRTRRAWRARADWGGRLLSGTGEIGTSKEYCSTSGSIRRTATNIPPAETFKAVANSKMSLPFSSWQRMKTGIASGKRCHLRRSGESFFLDNRSSWTRTTHNFLHLCCQ